MTNELAIMRMQGGALATGFGIEGIEGVTPEDIVISRLEILQPTSRKEGTPGYFFHNLDNTTLESVDAVILRISKTRVLWSGNQSDKTPECSSSDGITSRTYGECQGCQFNRWDTRNGTVKCCKSGFTFLCADPNNPESLFLLSAYGTSATPARVLLSQFVMQRRSPFQAVVKFSTKAEKGDKGKYFTLAPAITRWLSPADFAPFREASLAMQGVAIKEVEPDGSISDDIKAAQADVARQNAQTEEAKGKGDGVTWEDLASAPGPEVTKRGKAKAPVPF